jgi:plasmid maintenance system antidote protein VapI
MARAEITVRRTRMEAVKPLFDFIDAHGIRRKWIADQLGLTRQQIYKLAAGESVMQPDMYVRICEVVNAPRDIRQFLKKGGSSWTRLQGRSTDDAERSSSMPNTAVAP